MSDEVCGYFGAVKGWHQVMCPAFQYDWPQPEESKVVVIAKLPEVE